MKKIKVDSKAVIRDLALRVKANEEAVKSFLSRAGIECGTIRLEDLQQLQKINPDAFNEMVVYLYGKKAGADATTYDFVGGLIGSVVGTAGNTLAAIFGETDQKNVIALQQQQAERQQRLLYLVLGVVAVIGVVVAIIAMRGSGSHVTVAK